MTILEQDIQSELNQFTGTGRYWRYGSLNLTDGVHFLAEKCRCFWLIDSILLAQSRFPKLKDFQLWTLDVQENKSATLSLFKDTDKLVWTHKISHTDFPLTTIKLYCINDVLLLPSEY